MQPAKVIQGRFLAENLSRNFPLARSEVCDGATPFADRRKKTMTYMTKALSGMVYASLGTGKEKQRFTEVCMSLPRFGFLESTWLSG